MQFEYNQTDDYIELLKAEYGRRVHKNALYSLNAFARDLSLSPSRLSDLLNQKQGLSESSVDKIAEHFAFDSTGSRYFKALVASSSARSQANRDAAKQALDSIRFEYQRTQISRDSFHVIQEWYHFALVELVEIEKLKFDPQAAAVRLGLSIEEVELGLSRLLRLGLVVRTESGWQSGVTFSYTGDESPSKAVRHFHKQILAKAQAAVDGQAIEDRYLNSVVLSVRASELDAARQCVSAFVSDFTLRFGASDQRDSVYALSVQLFNLMAGPNV